MTGRKETGHKEMGRKEKGVKWTGHKPTVRRRDRRLCLPERILVHYQF